MRPILVAVLSATLALPAIAQDGWGNLDRMLGNSLAPGRLFERSFWLPDSANPAAAHVGLGIVYPIISGAAGNTGISAGIFSRTTDGWALTAQVSDLFGHAPRDHTILPGRIEVTTTMPGPNDPRCCPTLPVRWVIDRATGQARRLN